MTLKAAWKALFNKEDTKVEKDEKPIRHDFDQFDRIQSAELRRIRQNIERMNAQAQELRVKKQLEDAQDELYDDDDDDDDYEEDAPLSDLDAVMKLIGPILTNSLNASRSGGAAVGVSAPQPPTANKLEISDDEIRNYIGSYDKNKIKQAKALPKAVLKQQVKQIMGVDDEVAERAHQILITEY